jgi:hypothetical protein
MEKSGTCLRGHALTPDNVYTRPKGGWECKVCRKTSASRSPERLRLYRKRTARSALIGERVIRRVIAALDDGWTINRIGGLAGHKHVPGTKIVDQTRLRLFCAAQPKLGKIIMAKAEANRVAVKRAVIESRYPTIARPCPSTCLRIIAMT